MGFDDWMGQAQALSLQQMQEQVWAPPAPQSSIMTPVQVQENAIPTAGVNAPLLPPSQGFVSHMDSLANSPFAQDTLFPLIGGAPEIVSAGGFTEQQQQLKALAKRFGINDQIAGGVLGEFMQNPERVQVNEVAAEGDQRVGGLHADVETTLMHEAGHALDFRNPQQNVGPIEALNVFLSKILPWGPSEKQTRLSHLRNALRDDLRTMQEAGDQQYATTNPREHFAETFARALQALRDPTYDGAYAKIAEANAQIPGVERMSRFLLSLPLFEDHPLNQPVGSSGGGGMSQIPLVAQALAQASNRTDGAGPVVVAGEHENLAFLRQVQELMTSPLLQDTVFPAMGVRPDTVFAEGRDRQHGGGALAGAVPHDDARNVMSLFPASRRAEGGTEGTALHELGHVLAKHIQQIGGSGNVTPETQPMLDMYFAVRNKYEAFKRAKPKHYAASNANEHFADSMFQAVETLRRFDWNAEDALKFAKRREHQQPGILPAVEGLLQMRQARQTPTASAEGGGGMGMAPMAAANIAEAVSSNQTIEPSRPEAYKPGFSELVYANIFPRSYGDHTEEIFSVMHKAMRGDTAGININQLERDKHSPEREDAWRLYLGLPQRDDSFQPSPHSPSEAKDASASYFALEGAWEGILKKSWPVTEEFKMQRVGDEEQATHTYDVEAAMSGIEELVKGLAERPKRRAVVQARNTDVLGSFTLGLGEDENGPYISYYDKWDFSPEVLEAGYGHIPGIKNLAKQAPGSPFEIYDRLYYNPETFQPIEP